jgi:hypothetical protein
MTKPLSLEESLALAEWSCSAGRQPRKMKAKAFSLAGVDQDQIAQATTRTKETI